MPTQFFKRLSYLLLVIVTLNLPIHLALANTPNSTSAKVIALVENAALDTIWLGMRVQGGTGSSTDSVKIQLTACHGPGDISAFITGTFGQPQIYFSSADGINSHDAVTLPTNAHTHLSWAFTKPGVYEATLESTLVKANKQTTKLGKATFTFAVGVDPHSINRPFILKSDHIDITVNLNSPSSPMYFYGDITPGKPAGVLPANQATIAITNQSLTTIPPTPAYRFLGRSGQEIYILAQAVLGKHVHGELDPHIWQDARNAIAYVEVIKEALIAADPNNRVTYQAQAATYTAKLERLDDYMRTIIASIPASQRHLVTTHDGFGYLAKAYDINVAGFVAPNPAMEPTAQDMVALARTLQQLKVSAVFIEPGAVSHSNELLALAHQRGIHVCQIFSDTLTNEVPTYLDLMATNARNLKACLDPSSLPAWEFSPQGTKP